MSAHVPPVRLTGHVTDTRAEMTEVTAWGDKGERLIPGRVISTLRVTTDFDQPAEWNGTLTIAADIPMGTRFTITIEETT